MSALLTKHNNNLYTVGNYTVEWMPDKWFLRGNQIECVTSYDKDTLIKIACYLTNIEQQADLIRQMFELSVKEQKEREESEEREDD